jgi:hypothetical protein
MHLGSLFVSVVVMSWMVLLSVEAERSPREAQ